MELSNFVHLHIHSEYSLLDGSIKIKKLVKELVKRGAKAAALTDHDSMHGALEFYLACQDAGIKGIIGFEATLENYFQPDSQETFHLVLIAENNTGYQNLLKLCTLANTKGRNLHYPDSTSLTYDMIRENSEGLICLTSCLKGELNTLVHHGHLEKAKQYLLALQNIFGQNSLFVELIDNNIPQQKHLNAKLIALAEELSLGCVATADVHYLNYKDKETHLSLLAIKHKLQKSDVRGMPDDVHFHLMTDEEMNEKFSFYPSALENTLKISERCHLKIDTKSILMPDYREKEDESADECLQRLSRTGLDARKSAIQTWLKDKFTDEIWNDYLNRLEYELSVIIKMKFSGYFLIVQDYINWAKDNHIPVGPGRGSAAGSLVTYALRITNIDPIRFNLLFERFLNPDRISMPDIDTDFCQDNREKVLEYVYKKYGEGAVCQIITFGRMMAKNALKNLARITGWAFHESNDFAKLIPETPGITLEQAYEEEEKIRQRLESDERAKTLWDGSLEIEGTLNSLGIHAAGVIISDRPLQERCPLMESEGQLLTQFENKYAEKVGLIKFDFLGLKTLTVVEKALQLIKKIRNITIDIDSIDLEDKKVYEMLSTAHVTGVFQLESSGMRKLLSDLKPTCFTDIIAVLALFRPGPLGSGMVEDFVHRKHGQKKVEYPFPELEPILSDTYGVIVYQEQVQKIASVLASYSLGEADLLRRAMGKKDKVEMEKQKNRFVKGSTDNGFDCKKAEELFDLMAMFAEYGFNKSHTAAYGLITYQTAWLKTHYPTEFMTAIMSCDLDNTDKIVGYVRDCRRLKIKILPPSVNHSSFEFTIPRDNHIQFGLGAIKGLGENIALSIMKERDSQGLFETVPEFIARLDSKKLNKKTLESLIKAGAFDEIATNRAEILNNCEIWLRTIAKESENEDKKRGGLFDIFSFNSKSTVTEKQAAVEQDSQKHIPPTPLQGFHPFQKPTLILPKKSLKNIERLLIPIQLVPSKPWTYMEHLEYELAILGFYVSGHPTEVFAQDIEEFTDIRIEQIPYYLEPDNIPLHKRKTIKIAGIVSLMFEKKNKENQPFLALRLEDHSGEIELTLFPKQYAALSVPIKLKEPLFIECKINRGIEDGSVRGVIQSLERISDKRIKGLKRLEIETHEDFIKNTKNINKLIDIFQKNPGSIPVSLSVKLTEQNLMLAAKFQHKISPSDELLLALENDWPGELKIKRQYSQSAIIS